MKTLLSTCLILLVYMAKAQTWGPNIVVNPDFETATPPTGISQIAYATGWENGCGAAWDFTSGTANYNYQGTSDLHGSLFQGPQTPTSGAKSGNNFAGFSGADVAYPGPNPIPNNQNPDCYKESILGTLTELVTGCPYKLEYWASQPPTQAHIDNEVEVVLRTSDCSQPGTVVHTGALGGSTWQFFSTTFTLTPAQVANGYNRIEFRRVITPPGISGLSDRIYISIDSVSLQKADGPVPYFTQHAPLCTTDAPVDFFKCKPIFWGATYTAEVYETTGGTMNSIGTTGISTYTTSGPARIHIQFDPSQLTSGTYEVHLCDNSGGNCCTVIYFAVCEPPQVTISSSLCNPNSILTANITNPSYNCIPTYSWSTPCGTQTGNPITGCGGGPYVVTVDNETCPATTANAILIDLTLAVPPPITINLCTWSGQPFDPGVVPSNGNVSYSGTGIVNNQFDPNLAGPGVHTITATANYLSCSASTTIDITVNEEDYWHQTTINSSGINSQNDVVTDSQGNVYVVGYFTENTDLHGGGASNITISTLAGVGAYNAYVAKYDRCGNLIWAANTTYAENCFGQAITVDENNGMVYIAGDLKGYARFNSAQSNGPVCSSGYWEDEMYQVKQAYVAQYDMQDGCLYFVDVVSVGSETTINAMTVDEDNGHIFVGGSCQYLNTPQDFMYVRRYDPTTNSGTNNSIQGYVWQLRDNVTTGSQTNVVNDLDYDETSNHLGIIGDFQSRCYIDNGAGGLNVVTSAAAIDAFVAIYQDDVNAAYMYEFRAGGANSNQRMFGNGISFDAVNGKTYFTGAYSDQVNNPYNLNGIGTTTLAGTGLFKGYMIAIDDPGAVGWASAWSKNSQSTSASGSSYGIDVAAHNDYAYFAGKFETSDMTASGMPTSTYVGSGSDPRVSIMSYRADGLAQWVSSTQAMNQSSIGDSHEPTAVATDRIGHAFISGKYNGKMTYSLGTPSSGNLISSGSADGFILRSSINLNGALKHVSGGESPSKDETPEYIVTEVTASPNPTNGKTIVTIENANSDNQSITLIGMDGRVYHSLNFETTFIELDLTLLEDGIYLATINDGTSSYFVRIVKTN